jgi:MFS family permease
LRPGRSTAATTPLLHKRCQVMEQAERKARYKWWVVASVSMGLLISALDVSAIMVSLPTLARVFKTDSSVVSLLQVAFLVACQSLMLILGRGGDGLGRKKVYLTGLALYTISLLFCIFSQNIAHLILFRVLQGAGSATSLALGPAMAVAVFPPDERGRALGRD